MNQNPIEFEGREQIRCVQQISMLKAWERLNRDAGLPNVDDIHGDDLERVRDKLMVLDVVGDIDAPRYVIRFHGIDFERMNNRNCIGRFLDEAMPPAVRERGLQVYRDMLARGAPAFSVTAVTSSSGAKLSYERLLLPFTVTGKGVERIFTILTLFTEDNLSPFDIMHNTVWPVTPVPDPEPE